MLDPTNRNAAPSVARHIPKLAVVAAGLAIAFATLTPGQNSDGASSPWCLLCGPDALADAIANLVLFVPLGIGLAWAGMRGRRAIAVVALITLAIELLQWRIVAGRDASLNDLLTNLLGGALGYYAMRRRRLLLFPSRGRALALAATWAALWLAGTVTTAWALAPSLPPSEWWAHFRAPSAARNTGPVVLEARLANVPLRVGPVIDRAPIRAGLLAGDGLAVRAIIPYDSDPNAEIAVVDDAETERPVVAFRRRGSGIAFYLRLRVAVLRLRPPTIAVENFLSAAPSDTVRLSGALRDGRLQLLAERAGHRAVRTLELSPNWGWSFFAPPEYVFGRDVRPMTALWIAGLVLPIGYWAARASGARAGAVGAGVLAAVSMPAVALWAVPMIFGLPPVHWSEWAGWAAGIGLGVAAGCVPGSIVAERTPGTAGRPLPAVTSG